MHDNIFLLNKEHEMHSRIFFLSALKGLGYEGKIKENHKAF